MLRSINAGVLDVVFDDSGSTSGWPVILLHGFPYDIHAYDEVIPLLAGKGARVITPYLRGFGPTRFLSASTPRSGQQAAIGHDLLELMNALRIESAYLVGYDWGGRAACVVAALWPDRVRGLVSIGSYAIQDIASALIPADPEVEAPNWYQYYFHSERGRNALTHNRSALCQLLWRQWSPKWQFSKNTFEQTAKSFNNPDFVNVVIHSYRHRFGLVAGNSAYAQTEATLATLLPISVPTVALDAADTGFVGEGTAGHDRYFTRDYKYQVVAGAGHNLPQEQPEQLAEFILDLQCRTSSR